VFSVGSNSNGELGYTGTKTSEIQQITFFNENNKFISDISSGESYSLSITNKGEIYGWGSNSYYQLGIEGSDARYIPTYLFKIEL
jgi:alpha-tubulin suppressor-like RCC1 family protein